MQIPQLIASAGLFCSGVTTGLTIAYPALINDLFLTKRDMPIAQRLTVWNRGYDAGKRSIPLFALLSAGAYLGGAFVYPSSLSVGKGRRSAVVAALLHVSIGPITIFLIKPINDILMTMRKNAVAGERVLDKDVDPLLLKWTRLHNWRMAMTCMAFATGIASALGSPIF